MMDDECLIEELEQLLKIMEKLRSPEGCPWDKEQDYYSLKPCIIEEAYEVVEALENKDISSLKKELGDLLLQVVFQAQIGKEKGDFNLGEVISLLNKKLIRRHPHVFADKEVNKVSEVMKNWEQIKREEKILDEKEIKANSSSENYNTEKKSSEKNKSFESLLNDISYSRPALNQAYEVQKQAAKVGFDWDRPRQVLEKIEEEIDELKQALVNNEQKQIKNEVGDLFFSLVNLTRFYQINPEVAVFSSIVKFKNRFEFIEKKVKDSNKEFKNFSLEELDRFWIESKDRENDKKMEE